MPETTGNETPVSPTTRKRNERTEAKFFEDVEKIVAEAERLGAEYTPPNDIAKLVNLKTKRDATLAARTANQANEAAEENERNSRENLFKTLNKDVTSLVGYAKSAGKAENEVAALQSIARDVKGERAEAINPNDSRKAHLGRQPVLRHPRRQLFAFYRTIRRARNPDDRRPIQSRDAPHQTSRARRRH